MPLPRVAYFSMEMAIDQSIHTYSGGLGFLAGSHMLSAGQLDLPMVGVTMLWTNGYGEQIVNDKNEVEIVYTTRRHEFLEDTGLFVDVTIFGRQVKVTAKRLPPAMFGTVPVYFLTTDFEGNPEQDRVLSHKLYDSDHHIRVAQEIILGVGGFRILEAAKENIEVIHLNEGHALPVCFELLAKYNGNLDAVRERVVFTTHTPVAAGNEVHPAPMLHEAGFFVNTSLEEAVRLGGHEFSLTVAALRMSRMANGVSQLHAHVANRMWNWVDGRCPIVGITNAVNLKYWQDPRVLDAVGSDEKLLALKKEMKRELFAYIKETRGVTLNPDVFTIVWARRFTEYKRADLIFRDLERIKKLLETNKVQLIFSGKFHPKDTWGQQTYNKILALSKQLPNVVVVPTYELELSAKLKKGSDLWLNTPMRPLEASGTSGMSAAMNGCVNMSIFDGWSVEGVYHNLNGYIINEDVDHEYLPVDERNQLDYTDMMQQLENDVLPTYYERPAQWASLMRHAIQQIGYFNSDRMAVEYFTRLYKPVEL